MRIHRKRWKCLYLCSNRSEKRAKGWSHSKFVGPPIAAKAKNDNRTACLDSTFDFNRSVAKSGEELAGALVASAIFTPCVTNDEQKKGRRKPAAQFRGNAHTGGAARDAAALLTTCGAAHKKQARIKPPELRYPSPKHARRCRQAASSTASRTIVIGDCRWQDRLAAWALIQGLTSATARRFRIVATELATCALVATADSLDPRRRERRDFSRCMGLRGNRRSFADEKSVSAMHSVA